MQDSCVVCGCMFAGKTTHLVEMYRALVAANQSIYAIKHDIDTRYSASDIVSHNGEAIQADACSRLMDIPQTRYARVNWVLIDEAQFFPDLAEFAAALRGMGTRYIIAGLDLDHSRAPFGQTLEVAAATPRVLYLRARCGCGAEAAYTKKVRGTSDTIEVGGADLYRPACSRCYEQIE